MFVKFKCVRGSCFNRQDDFAVNAGSGPLRSDASLCAVGFRIKCYVR